MIKHLERDDRTRGVRGDEDIGRDDKTRGAFCNAGSEVSDKADAERERYVQIRI